MTAFENSVLKLLTRKAPPNLGAHPRRIAIGHSSVHAEAQNPHSGNSLQAR